jgi:uncharacterized protein YrrD
MWPEAGDIMQKLSGIVGKSIVTADTGQRLGQTADVLFDSDRTHVIGLVVSGGWFKNEAVLPYEHVHALGGDAVIARGTGHLMDAKEWKQSGRGVQRSSALTGKPIVTATGERLGVVSDIAVDPESGAVRAIEVRSPKAGGLLTRRAMMPAETGIKVGRDFLVVSNGTRPVPKPDPSPTDPIPQAPIEPRR